MDILKAALVAGISYGLLRFLPRVVRNFRSPLRALHGPKSSSLLSGNIIDISKSVSPCIAWIEKYGRVIQIAGFLGESRLVTIDIKATNYIITHSVDYQKPPEARKASSRVFGGDGILFAEGDKHRQQRRIMNPSFGPSPTKDLVPVFLKKAIHLRDILLANIASAHVSQQEIDILPWLSRTTLDVIGLAGFDYQFEALSVNKEPTPLNKALSTIFNANGSINFLRILQALFPTLAYLPTQRRKDEKIAQETMTSIAEKLVQKRKDMILGIDKASGELGNDLLSAMVSANMDTELPESQRMSHEEVLAQIPTFFVAGHETTSTQTTWALFLLCQNKDIQQKLYEEVMSVPTDTPSADDLFELPLLDAVVRETMRVHCAVPMTSRVAMHDDVIPVSEPFTDKYGRVHSEIRVNKGDAILIPIHAINCSKDIWGEDALEFNPDRWSNLPEAAKDIPGVWGNLMTFLGGSRSCIGYRFALYEMKALLFILIRTFTFELAVPADMIEARVLGVARPYLKDDDKSGSQLPVIIRPRVNISH